MSTDTDISEAECEIEIEGQSYTRLTEVVRNQYFKYLQKQLKENVNTWTERRATLPEKENKQLETLIYNCAKSLEDLAIKEAIITQLYQKAMLKTISTVRQNTKECQLLEQLEQHIFNLTEKSTKATDQSTNTILLNYSTKETQTDDLEPSQLFSLDERINLFQKQLHIQNPLQQLNKRIDVDSLATEKVQRKRHYEDSDHNYRKKYTRTSNVIRNKNKLSTNLLHSPSPPPPLPSQTQPQVVNAKNSNENFAALLEGDEIAKELEKIFNETDEEEDLEKIFGITIINKQNNTSIIQSTTDLTKETNNFNETQIMENEMTPTTLDMATETNRNNFIKSNPQNETTTSKTPTQNGQLYREPINDLRYSLWPCEYFMQKRRLSATLNRLVEEDIRWYDILWQQFSILFGDSPETDDFAQCSPSLELDEILRSSCAKRISPWVVTHLMKPLKDGLIGNRFLFKKLAKKLAHCIITENQYPDEIFIKRTIENFFCLHRSVMTAEDINDIDEMDICNGDD